MANLICLCDTVVFIGLEDYCAKSTMQIRERNDMKLSMPSIVRFDDRRSMGLWLSTK